MKIKNVHKYSGNDTSMDMNSEIGRIRCNDFFERLRNGKPEDEYEVWLKSLQEPQEPPDDFSSQEPPDDFKWWLFNMENSQ